MSANLDPQVVRDFGREWSRFDQDALPPGEQQHWFDAYFHLFPWDRLPPDPRGLDLGCGSGRWAQLVAPRVGELLCVDPSAEALAVARRKLAAWPNCRCQLAGVDEIPAADASLDFIYSLGVLHHVPDTAAAIRACAAKLRPGGFLLLYLYYAFDGRPAWFRALWRASDLLRRAISRLPAPLKYGASQLLAAVVYWPLSRLAAAAERLGADVSRWPLSAYRDKSFYTLRTDALDRFGTRLEQRFTRAQIAAMLAAAGLAEVRFSDRLPYWCAVSRKPA